MDLIIDPSKTEEQGLKKQFDKVINKWKPNRKQELFLRLPFTIKEALIGGGAGTGKSDVLLLYGICHKLHENPRFKQVFMRRTHQDLKKEIVQRSREFYTPFGATFNQQDMCWTFPRYDQYGSGSKNAGSMIFLGHCEHETNVHMYDSMEISIYTPDELTNYIDNIYLYIAFERNRSPKNSGLPSITRAGAMPGGIGHTFVKKRFVDPCPEGGKVIVGRGGNKRIYIHATLHDNLDNIDPTYAQSLEGRPEAEKRAKLYGDWSAYLGLVFDEFRDKRYPDEPENALHVVEPFEIPMWWPRFFVGDWGYRAMTYIAFIAISPDKRVYVYRELYWLKTKIEDWAPVLSSFIDEEQPKSVKFCRSVAQDRGQENTIQAQIEAAIGRPIELSTHTAGSRVAGKVLLHEFLRWKSKPTAPMSTQLQFSEERALWLMRNKGVDEYKSYMGLFTPVLAESNLPKLQIFRCDKSEHKDHVNCCPLMIESIKACSYDKPKAGNNGKLAEDVAEFEGDDPYDTLRYAIDTASIYFADAGEEFARYQRESAYAAQLSRTNDVTAYYRNMRQLDSEESLKPVMKFHKR